jgi:hypothetical protein
MDAPVARSKVPILGLILLILFSVVIGIAIGALVAAIRVYAHFYLVLAFPIFMGALAGGAISAVAKVGKVRSGAVAIFFGLLAGIIMYGTYRYGQYFLEKQQFYNDHPKVDRAQLDVAIDESLKDETGQAGFIGYIISTAKDGIRIVPTSSATSSSSSSNLVLSGPLAYGYWVVEILIILGVAAATAGKSASVPFCDRDGRFFATQNVGRVPKDSADQFMLMAKAGDWQNATLLLDRSRSKVNYPYLEVRVDKCPACNTNPLPLSIVRKMSSKKNTDKVIFKATLTPTQYGDLVGVPVDPLRVIA